MLSPELKARLELALAARRSQLEAEIREKLSAAREATGSSAIDQLIESGDAAVAEPLVDADLAAIKRDLVELQDIDGARRRLADGTYGVCADCAGEIPPPRLEAYPTALRCVDCQSLWEADPAGPRGRR